MRHKNNLFKVISTILLMCALLYLVSAYPLESDNYLMKTTVFSSGTNTSSANFILSSSLGDISGNLSATTRGEVGYFYMALASPSNISNPLTISLWIKRDATFSKDTPIACKWNRTLGIALKSYCLGIDSDNKTKFFISSDGITFSNVSGAEKAPLNRWAFITAVYNDTHISIYTNGIRDSSTAYSQGYFTTSLPLIIGAGDLNGSERRFFNGTLDELSLWASALSPAQINALYEKDKTRFEFLISNSTDFLSENIIFARLMINNETESSHADDDYTLLLEHFNSKAKISANNGTIGSAKIRAGKFGNGLEISNDANLTYPKAKRFNDAEGTIEMWLKPKLSYNDNTARFFFDDSSSKFRLYKDTNNNLIWEINGTQLSYDISAWTANSNHHVAVTWKQNKNQSIIIDGILRNQSKLTTLGTSGALLYIGTNSSNKLQANAIIDELRISSIARTPSSALANSSYTLQGFEALSEDTYYWKSRTTDIDARGDKVKSKTFSEWSGYSTLSVEVAAPTISLVYPTNNSYASATEVSFNYTPKDANLDACELWLNASGWQLNQTDLSPVSKAVNQFKVNLSDNAYLWNIQCNDTSSNKAFSSNNFTVTVDIVEPVISLLSPANNTVATTATKEFIYNATDTNPILNCALIINNKINITNTTITRNAMLNFTATISADKYNFSINCTDSAGNVNSTETRALTVFKAEEFTGKTTNFSSVNQSNITTLVLELHKYGIIKFGRSVDLSKGYDLDSNIELSSSKIELDSKRLNLLNISANITMYNLSLTDPFILRDGLECPSSICAKLSYSGGNLTFNVSHFTLYTAIENPETTTTTTTTTVVSGGGGGTVTVKENVTVTKPEIVALDIIAPAGLSMHLQDKVIVPLILLNKGNFTLKEISLTAQSTTQDLSLEFTQDRFDKLEYNEQVKTDLIITSHSKPGKYEVIITANVKEPEFTDTTRILIELIDRYEGNKSLVEEQIRFVSFILEKNTECLELKELLNQAQDALEKQEFEKAMSLATAATETCRDLITSIRKPPIEKPSPAPRLNILELAMIGGLILIMLIGIIYNVARVMLRRGPKKVRSKRK